MRKASKKGRSPKDLSGAISAVAAGYVAEHKTEASLTKLAEALMGASFQMCVYCQEDDGVINLASIEFCQEAGCPLREVNSKMATTVAAAATLLEDKKGPPSHLGLAH